MQVGTWRDGLRPIIRMVGKLLVLLLAGAGAMGGMILANKLYPRDSTVETIGVVAGIAAGVLIWWPVNSWLYRLVAPTSTGPTQVPATRDSAT